MTQAATDVTDHGSPLFYDKIAQELNDEIYKLGHIDDLYNVTFTEEDEEDTFPAIYVNDGTKVTLRVLPDSSKSMSFFAVDGEMTELDELHMAIPMMYVVWMNLLKVSPAKAYDYTEEILKDCYNTVKNYGGYDIAINVNDPLAQWTMLEGKAATMRPYSAFAISFTKNIQICT